VKAINAIQMDFHFTNQNEPLKGTGEKRDACRGSSASRRLCWQSRSESKKWHPEPVLLTANCQHSVTLRRPPMTQGYIEYRDGHQNYSKRARFTTLRMTYRTGLHSY